jgi:hypothetical protein
MKEPSRRLPAVLLAALTALVLLPAAANAASLQVSFPQSPEVTVVQGQSASFMLEVKALGATRCDATTAPVRFDTLYSIDAVGDIASGVPEDMPIQTDESRGSSGNCYIKDPSLVPLTATVAAGTRVGDYTSVVRYGKGGDGGVDLDGPPLTIHVIAPDQVVAEPLPTPELAPPELVPPEMIVLGDRKVAPHPTLGKTLLLARVKGTVYFRIPGKARTILGSPMVVPNGTIVDASKGVVKVTVVRDANGVFDSVDAWDGAFKASQALEKPPVTTFTLADPLSASKKGANAARVQLRQRAIRKRSLWVNGKGNFKTRGKRASAIVRGTYWHTEETAKGTRVSVKRGLVAVRDFVRKRTVLVSTGHQYTAKIRSNVARRVPAFTGTYKG